MSWFENQMAYSKLKDDEALSESYISIASAVTGKRIQQTWQDETVAAKTALEDICRYFKLRPVEIPETITDLNRQLDYVFQPNGVMRRTVGLTKAWYRDGFGAMLGTFRENGKPVALLPGKMGGYTFHDPQTGVITRITKKNCGLFDDDAIVFYRSLPARPISFKDLIFFMKSSLTVVDVFWYLGAMAVITLLGMLTPKLNNVLFSHVTVSGSMRLLLGVILFMVCQSFAVQLIGGIRMLLLEKINTKISLSVQSAAIMRLFSMPPEFFKTYSSGELTEHVQYINALSTAIVSMVFGASLSGVFSLAYFTQIFRYSRALVAPALLIILCTLVFNCIVTLGTIKISRERMKVSAQERGVLYSIISGIQKIRLCGAEKRGFVRWANVYAKEAALTFSPPKILLLSNVISVAIGSVGTILLYFQAARSGISVADYYSFSTAYAYISAAMSALVGVAQTIASIKPILQIVKPIFDGQPEIAEHREYVTRLSGSIELSHITFQYPNSDVQVFKDFSLKIQPGQYVAIVGESGCGKTTLMRLLLGFEMPQKGSVFYDGKDLNSLDKKSLRRNIGCVMQNASLMSGDIFSNITVSAPWLTLDDAWEAAEIAGIADDIRAMPMGMNTIVQEGSGGISGGQKQRIMIARAVAPKPKILFLDEATSALDNITQKHVSEALDKMRCTRIVIAHRLSTIRQCDRILFIKDGCVCEDGTYEELIAKKGAFAELVQRQMVAPQE